MYIKRWIAAISEPPLPSSHNIKFILIKTTGGGGGGGGSFDASYSVSMLSFVWPVENYIPFSYIYYILIYP